MANRGDSRLGHRVRVIRQAMDLKQGPFGAFFGRDAATVSRYESGKIPLHPETVATINYLAGLVIARIGQEEFAVRLADVPAPQPRRGYSRTRTPSAGHVARWIHETLGDSGMTAEELAGIIKSPLRSYPDIGAESRTYQRKSYAELSKPRNRRLRRNRSWKLWSELRSDIPTVTVDQGISRTRIEDRSLEVSACRNRWRTGHKGIVLG